MKYKVLIIILLSGFYSIIAYAQPIHPRGLLSSADIPPIREKIKSTELNYIFENFKKSALPAYDSAMEKKASRGNYYAEVGETMAQLYLLTGDETWAKKSMDILQLLFDNDSIMYDDRSFGLTRSSQLRAVAQSYDYCYHIWPEDFKLKTNKKIYDYVKILASNAGTSANNEISSNWMGVRYGSIAYATLIYDEALNENKTLKHFNWEASRRLSEHTIANITPNGYNRESLGYHNYAWRFVSVALIAGQAKYGVDDFRLENFAPNALKAPIWQIGTTVAIDRNIEPKGLKPDYSDDNAVSNSAEILGHYFRLYPKNLFPTLCWFTNYIYQPNQKFGTSSGVFYTLIYFPKNIEAQNPAQLGWDSHYDPEQMVAYKRNRFADHNDIVITHNATAQRTGHNGSDSNTWRLIGLGSQWVSGSGRTSNPGGQPLVFALNPDSAKGNAKPAKMTNHRFTKHDMFTRVVGSCVGTQNHIRVIHSTFDSLAKAQMAMLLSDSSDDGKYWRLATPEYNNVTVNKDGFTITSPNGSKLIAKVVENKVPLKISLGKFRYGFRTTDHNPGHRFGGKQYDYSKTIDISIDKNIKIVFVLLNKNEKIPSIKYEAQINSAKIGDYWLSLY